MSENEAVLLLLAVMLRQSAHSIAGRYSYAVDEAFKDNYCVWDDQLEYIIYEENTYAEAVVITALLNLGLPSEWEGLEAFVKAGVHAFENPVVKEILALLDKVEKESNS